MAKVTVVSPDLDTEDQAKEWMKAYYRNYRPEGYDTALKVVKLPVTGKWAVTGSRQSSCD